MCIRDRAMTEETVDREAAVQILAPNGVCVKFARVRGVGKFMLSIKGRDQDLELLNVRENQTEAYTWEAALRVLCGLCPTPKTRTSWEAVYGEPYPEDKKEFAPAQEKKAEPVKEAEEKPEARTEPRSEDGTAAGRAEQRDEETEPQEPETGADQESGEVIEETEAQESTICLLYTSFRVGWVFGTLFKIFKRIIDSVGQREDFFVSKDNITTWVIRGKVTSGSIGIIISRNSG